MGRLGVKRVGGGWFSLCLGCLLAALPLWGQSPGAGDTKQKQAPPGQAADPSSTKSITRSFSGVLEGVIGNSLVLETTDSRTIFLQYAESTKFIRQDKEARASDFEKGEILEIEARAAAGGRFFAVSVQLSSEPAALSEGGPSKSRPQGEGQKSPPKSETTPSTTPASSEQKRGSPPRSRPEVFGEDPGPPVLRRSKPDEDQGSQAFEAAEQSAGRLAAESSPTHDPLLRRAHEMTAKFTRGLPNFVCRQVTTRYWSESAGRRWDPMDVVETDVIFEGGHESYRNVKINNRRVKEGKEHESGTWSTGEYGTALRHILERPVHAEFRFRKTAYASGVWAAVYDFRMEKDMSRWQVAVDSQTLFPEFQGSIWVDQKTFRVVRLEMQAVNIPREFPLDRVEMTVDYGNVRIGPGEYLLPVIAENLSCWRRGGRCSRNRIEFRNYGKFTSEAVIYHTDSTLSFENEGKSGQE